MNLQLINLSKENNSTYQNSNLCFVSSQTLRKNTDGNISDMMIRNQFQPNNFLKYSLKKETMTAQDQFNQIMSEIYADRDNYSRGKIIELAKEAFSRVIKDIQRNKEINQKL